VQQANQPFFYSTADGVEHFVAKGDTFPDKDPALKGREGLFNSLDPVTAKPAPKPTK
jgi:hypothetical protein